MSLHVFCNDLLHVLGIQSEKELWQMLFKPLQCKITGKDDSRFYGIGRVGYAPRLCVSHIGGVVLIIYDEFMAFTCLHEHLSRVFLADWIIPVLPVELRFLRIAFSNML